MSFTQFIQHKTLSFKFDDSAKLMDSIIDDPDNHKVVEHLKLKNVCAKIPQSIVDRLENTIGILNISKREFIQYAIVEALDKSDEIMHDLDITEFHEDDQVEESEK